MSNRRDAETESHPRSAANATFRPVLRTVCFIAGVTALVVAIGGYASLTRSVEGAPVGSGGGIGAAIFVILVVMLLGLELVGLGVLLPGRGGGFTIPPARPTRGQRALVILGVGLVATVPLFPLAPGRISLALHVFWSVGVLLLGLSWIAIDRLRSALGRFSRPEQES